MNPPKPPVGPPPGLSKPKSSKKTQKVSNDSNKVSFGPPGR